MTILGNPVTYKKYRSNYTTDATRATMLDQSTSAITTVGRRNSETNELTPTLAKHDHFQMLTIEEPLKSA